MEKKIKIIGKKILCSLLVLMMVMFSVPFIGAADSDLAVIASAADKALGASGQCGENVYWSYDSSTGEVVISGEGEMWNYRDDIYSYSPFADSSVSSVVIEAGVTSIGNHAFRKCTLLESVIIPNSVTSIGNFAFFTCSKLSSVTIPNSVTSIGQCAFSRCSKLTNITIPDSVIDIGDHAFNDCSNLSTVTIGSGLTSSCISLFYECSNLNGVTVSKTNKVYCNDEYGVLFNKDKTMLITYPAGNERTSYSIPDGVKYICDRSFIGCKSLESVTIPGSVKNIDRLAFYESANLKSVKFESGKRNLTISSRAFDGCTNLNNIDLHGDRVYAIEADAFINTAYFNDESNWDKGVLYLNDIILNTDPYKLGPKYTIKDGTTTLGYGAYFVYLPEGCTESKYALPVEVTVPDSVDNFSIGNYIFCEEIPENPFRFSSNVSVYSGLSESFYKKFTETYGSALLDCYNSVLITLNENGFEYEIMKIYQKIDELFPNLRDLSIKEKIVLSKKGLFTGSYNGFVISCLNTGNGNGAICLDEGIKGIADVDTITSLGFSFVAFLSPYMFDGLILPKSFESLYGYTSLCDYLTSRFATGSDESEIAGKSITFLNPDCTIFDDENTLWEGYTICGYTGSTAQAYAEKYNRKFVAIDYCKHEKTCFNAKIEPTCESKGYSGDLHCQYCGVLLEEGKMVDKLSEHNYGEAEVKTYPTCTERGTAKYTCKDCGYETILPYGTLASHSYASTTIDPTCTSNGYTLYTCACGDSYTGNTVPALGHTDNDSNGYCDRCGDEIAKNCSCNCHKSGFIGILWKIQRLFYKLFKTNQHCSCGAKHY